VDPSDREVSFTLGLAPKGFFPQTGGFVMATLHYHDGTGNKGDLAIAPPNDIGTVLAPWLGFDVKVVLKGGWDGRALFEQVVTPKGVSRGEESSLPCELAFEQLAMPDFYLPSAHELPQSLTIDEVYNRRRPLNDLILSQGKIGSVITHLHDPEKTRPVWLELCVGLPGDDCEKAMLDLIPDPEALKALASRHLVHPSDTLADVVIKGTSWGEFKQSYAVKEYCCKALALRPRGRWFEALDRWVDKEDDLINCFYLRWDDLSLEQRNLVYNKCLKMLEKSEPSPGLIRVVLRQLKEIRLAESTILSKRSSERTLECVHEVLGLTAIERSLHVKVYDTFLPEYPVKIDTPRFVYTSVDYFASSKYWDISRVDDI
jgi:hypothetical protein